jgi:hypothetical protein
VKPILRLCRDLGLPEGSPFTQDWAYELPDEYRDEGHFLRYVEAYGNSSYGDAERHELMTLMLDVANDLLEQEPSVGLEAWARLIPILTEHIELHREHMEYWALDDEEFDDVFALTPLVRQFLGR